MNIRIITLKEVYCMQTFKYANNEEFLEAFGKELVEAQKRYSRTQLTVNQIFKVYLSVTECLRVVHTDDYEEMLFPDYENQTYTSNIMLLYAMFGLVGQQFDLDARPWSDSTLKKLIKDNFYDAQKVRQAVYAPSHLVITKGGKIYDMRAQQYVDYDPQYYYDASYDVDPFEQIDKSSAYYQAANLLLDSWSQFDQARSYGVRLVIYLALLGYGAESIVLLTGHSGSGKSAFIKMLINLVNDGSSLVFDFCSITNDKILKCIKPTTRLVFSHTLPDDYVFSNRATQRMKALASSDYIDISEKEKCEIALKNRGLKIQEAYVLPKFTVKPGELIDDHLIILDFGNVNHRRDRTVSNKLKSLTGKVVSELIEDQQFLNMITLIILQEFKFVE